MSIDKPWLKFWPEGMPKQIDYPKIPLFEILSNSAEKYLDCVACSSQDHDIAYRELDILTSRLAAAFIDFSQQGIE